MVSLLLIITGASRGLGRAIANAFCIQAIESGLLSVDKIRLILMARSQDGLDETGQTIQQHYNSSSTAAPTAKIQLEFSTHAVDLSDLDHLDENFDKFFVNTSINFQSFDRIVFINNAGSLGFLGPCVDSPSLKDMQKNLDLNITSALWLSVRFARRICDECDTTNKSIPAVLVQISSLLAVEQFKSMGIYGAGKAARDHYHKTMAKEISSDKLKILNYAPGPLETEMVEEIRAAPKLDDGLKPAFHTNLLQPEDSAWKLVQLILKDQYETGQHVDYYDLPSDKNDEK